MTGRQRNAERDTRLLVFAPTGRDGELTQAFLDRASVPNVICRSMADLCDTFETEGAGGLLMTEEALDDPALPRLVLVLAEQPSWSDVPVLLFTGGAGADMTERTIRAIETLRNVTLFERPIRLAAVITAVRAARRGRERQYQVRDLLVELEDARAAAEDANRLKDEFLATLSHELRTPLNAILGWTSMLTHGHVGPERMPRVFEALDRNAQAQAQLIADVLDVSRIISGKLELTATTVDMADVAWQGAESVRPTAAAKEIELTVKGAHGCLVRGDANRLQQVVWNLLSNAVKFTPSHGVVELVVDHDETNVSVTVTDTGNGMPPQFLPYVFDRFRQADQTSTRVHGGLGLGLAIVKHLVELHGGTVGASSDGPGTGSCFRVTLPLERDAQVDTAAKAPQAPAADISLVGRTILVVDDDSSTREVVAAALERTGARVSVAASAAEGFDALRLLPDLLIADLGMPSEDGFSFIRRVRQSATGERLPAIALSAFADARSEETARAAGFSAFVAKPARPETLLRVVDALLPPRIVRNDDSASTD